MKINLRKFGNQFLKFVFTGGINTFLDFGVLNLLIYLFGLSANGYNYIIFKSISFIVAVINSYVLNKYWVFQTDKNNQDIADIKNEIGSFFTVSVIGLVINVGVSYAVFFIGSSVLPSILDYIWVNVGAFIGSITTLLWNFFGYKFWVFKKSEYCS